jgi:hypothetical protein
MVRSAKIVVALLCIVCVLALCVAPYADIPVSALKSLEVVLLLMLSLAAAALPRAHLFLRVLFRIASLRTGHTAQPCPLLLPTQTSCVLQC